MSDRTRVASLVSARIPETKVCQPNALDCLKISYQYDGDPEVKLVVVCHSRISQRVLSVHSCLHLAARQQILLLGSLTAQSLRIINALEDYLLQISSINLATTGNLSE